MNRSARSRAKKEEEYAVGHHPVERALLCSTHLRQFKHHVFPGLNGHHVTINTVDGIDDARNFYQVPPALISKPLPCVSSNYVSEPAYPNSHDCVLKLVKAKWDWKSKEKRWTKLAKNSIKDKKVFPQISYCLNNDLQITNLPYIITKLTDHLARDPDKYFDGHYNWYYGNALTTTNIGDESCLFFAGGENLHKFCFSMYNRPSSSNVVPEVSPKICISLADDSPILDIVSSKKNGSIGVRQRDNCYFFLYRHDDENVSINKCLTFKANDHPFISMDVGDMEFCTIDSSRELKFWSPTIVRYPLDVISLPVADYYVPDKFAQVKYVHGSDYQTYAVVDRRKLYFYDKRSSCKKPSCVWDPYNLSEMCEDISLLVPSIMNGHWYLGMTHTALLFDSRAGFVQKWTHMLAQAPSLGCTQRLNMESNSPKEYLVLSTQFTSDVVVIHNKWTGDVPKSDVLPVNVPNRIDTVHEARLNGVLSDPSIAKKFTRSCIGLDAYKRKKRMGIFSLSSTGDVFHQCVERYKQSTWNAEKNVKLSQAEVNHLKQWETEYMENFQKRKPLLKVTRLVDLTPLAECVEYENPQIPEWSVPSIRGKAPWKKSKKTLESYADFLTPHILEDFGIYEESEWGSDSEDETANVQNLLPESIGKVSSWLNTINANPDMEEADIEQLLNRDQRDADEDEEMESYEISISSTESVGKRPE